MNYSYIISLDIEKSFSTYINILTLYILPYNENNLVKYIVLYLFSNLNNQ